jgi:hypothetical protein
MRQCSDYADHEERVIIPVRMVDLELIYFEKLKEVIKHNNNNNK